MDSPGGRDDGSDLDYEAWRGLLRAVCGQYNPEGVALSALARSVPLPSADATLSI
jgi:hypothetical protein